jgi:hypothetical protein
MTARAAAWLLGGISVLSIATAVVAQLRYPSVAFDPAAATVFILSVSSFTGGGAILAYRVPANRVGWLLFDRARYDGERVVRSFSDRLRNSVDLVELRASLVATAGEAVRPTGATHWLAGEGTR